MRAVRTLCACLVALLLAACASAPPAPSSPRAKRLGSEAAEYALDMVGHPYKFGGHTPAGFDCSGLVHYSYKRAGLVVPRDTQAQRNMSYEIRASELQPGDLLFFNEEGRKASHVGIYLGEGRFVHAPSTGGRVRVDNLRQDYWRRHFVYARRF
ncbi:MAG TPA: C40 family peptidase [Burkholderiales bacterium]|nr:C40 family peptidase [Burkholderiales bacterium]